MRGEAEMTEVRAAEVVRTVAAVEPNEPWPISVSEAVRALCILKVKEEL